MRRSLHRPMRILSTALITAGLVVFADVATTLLWEEPVSAAYNRIEQSRAGDQLADLEDSFSTEVEGDFDTEAQTRVLAKRFERQIGIGDAIGRIKVPGIGMNLVLMNGTDTETLRRGPGRYPQTPLPGLGGTTGIAGHRTTYSAPFRRINEIEDGDEIRIELPYADFTYEVQKHQIVDPGDVHIVNPVGYERIVLTACHPLYSAAQRYAVFARLTGVEAFAVNGASGREAAR
ncbi:MAG: class E sortase [Solirubrobacterales bacterium]